MKKKNYKKNYKKMDLKISLVNFNFVMNYIFIKFIKF